MIIKEPIVYLLGHAKVRLLKFFLNNRGDLFTVANLADKTKIPNQDLRKELKQAVKYGVVEEAKIDKVYHYRIKECEEVKALEDIIFKLGDPFFEALRDKIETVGKVKLAIVMGIFLQRDHDRVDLFLVVDDLNDKKFEAFIGAVESELGTEIRYALLSSKDFDYRRNMFDKFVLSILEDIRTRVIIDKIGTMDDNT